MTRKVTVYVVDPHTQTIQAEDLDAACAFSRTYDLIGCQLVEVVPFDDNHVLVVDEEGLRDGMTEFTIWDGSAQPLAGRIVVASLNGASLLSAQMSIGQASKRFECCRAVLDPVFAEGDANATNGVVIAGGVIGFRTRIARHAPVVIEAGAP